MMSKSEFGSAVWEKVDKELVGDPVTVGAWTVTPMARLWGSQGGKVEGLNGGGGARLRLDPVAVTVAGPADGSTQRVEIDDPTSTALRGMAGAGLVVAGISLAVQFWARSRRKR
jgi:hypothetical protein